MSMSSGGAADGLLFVTPRVLNILAKILMSFVNSLVESNERDSTLHDVMSSGISQMMFRYASNKFYIKLSTLYYIDLYSIVSRIILRNPLKTETNFVAWMDSCRALSVVIEALITLSKLDRSVSVILIGEKKCISVMFDLLEVEVPASTKGELQF